MIIRTIFFTLFLLPLFFSCQKYHTSPYDKKEEILRSMSDSTKVLLLDSLWQKRDSLTYLRFKGIEQLVLTETDSIPGWITKFDKLKILYVSNYHKKIKTIPNNIGKLINLEQIDLPRNNISYIPISLFSLKKLERLSLGENTLVEIHGNIKNLKELKVLLLKDNKISTISDSICQLKKLERLNISGNLINKIPFCFKKLTLIQSIAISNNKISYIPLEVVDLPKLNEIHAKGLKLKNYQEVKAICEKRNITFYYDE